MQHLETKMDTTATLTRDEFEIEELPAATPALRQWCAAPDMDVPGDLSSL
jgi:hypothetical protein